MFKGESDLNVFNDSTALKQLVAKFSDLREFDKYVDYSKCDVKDSSVINDNKVDTSHYVISDDFLYEDKNKDNNIYDSDMNIRTVKDFIVFTGEYYGSLSVDNGKLNLNINKYSFDSGFKNFFVIR